jgi:hypothetical protein
MAIDSVRARAGWVRSYVRGSCVCHNNFQTACVDDKFTFVLGSILRFHSLSLALARIGQSSLRSDTGTTAFYYRYQKPVDPCEKDALEI